MKKIIAALILLFCLQPIAGAQVEYGAVEEATIELLSLSISADKSSYKIGEPVKINVALQNIDRARRRRLFLSGADLVFEINDARIMKGCDDASRSVSRAVIYDEQLEIREALVENAFDSFSQIFFAVVNRHND